MAGLYQHHRHSNSSMLFDDDNVDGCSSPASSTLSLMSVGTDTTPSSSSPSPSPSPGPHPHPHSPQNSFRFRNVYEERLQPLFTARSEAPAPDNHRHQRPLPTATHRSGVDPALQARFDAAVAAASYPDLEELLRSAAHRININAYDPATGQTALQRFCVAGELSLIQLMVRYGADSRLCSRDGWSPVHMAAWSGRPEVMLYVMDCSKRS